MNNRLVFYAFFLLFAWSCFAQRVLEIRSHMKQQGEVSNAWTLRAMIFAHLFFFFGSLTELFLYPRVLEMWVVLVGILIFLAGFFLRKWVVSTLGRFWSVHIEIRKDHEFITKGPYALCRHPNYLAILLEVIGFCLIANAYFALIASFFLYSLALLSRVRLEEKAMIEKFGEQYVAYKTNVPMLVPRLLSNKLFFVIISFLLFPMGQIVQ